MTETNLSLSLEDNTNITKVPGDCYLVLSIINTQKNSLR